MEREDADERREEDDEKERGVGSKVVGLRLQLCDLHAEVSWVWGSDYSSRIGS